MPEDVRITVGLAVLAVVAAGDSGLVVVVAVAEARSRSTGSKIRDPKARADIEDNYQKTVGQALGGIAVLLGAGLAYLQFSQQQRASHDLLISNQVSKGFEQLGSEKVVVRLGGIYALEGVMNNSDQYHQPVLEALTAFIREGTRTETTLPPMPALPLGALSSDFFHMYTYAPPLPTDIQAALTVIGRRSAYVSDEIDLSDANLTCAHLFYANLTRARMIHTDLHDALLSDVNLIHAALFQATLTGANLTGADLTRANLTGANLVGASLDARSNWTRRVDQTQSCLRG